MDFEKEFKKFKEKIEEENVAIAAIAFGLIATTVTKIIFSPVFYG